MITIVIMIMKMIMIMIMMIIIIMALINNSTRWLFNRIIQIIQNFTHSLQISYVKYCGPG